MKTARISTGVLLILLLTISLFLTGCISLMVKPSAMVSLGAFTNPGEIKEVRKANPDGTGAGVFTVPGGKVLVITRVIIHPINPGSGTLQLVLLQSVRSSEDRTRQTWIVPSSRPTEFDFSPGYVISSKSVLKIKNDESNSGSAHVSIYGYITSGS